MGSNSWNNSENVVQRFHIVRPGTRDRASSPNLVEKSATTPFHAHAFMHMNGMKWNEKGKKHWTWLPNWPHCDPTAEYSVFKNNCRYQLHSATFSVLPSTCRSCYEIWLRIRNPCQGLEFLDSIRRVRRFFQSSRLFCLNLVKTEYIR